MDRIEMLEAVTARARLGGRAEADRLVRATLETLGERVVSDEARDLASQLPTELQDTLRTDHEAATFGCDEFLSRVKERAGLEDGQELEAVRAVFGVMAEAVSEGELHDVMSQLPNDYEPLVADAGGLRGRR